MGGPLRSIEAWRKLEVFSRFTVLEPASVSSAWLTDGPEWALWLLERGLRREFEEARSHSRLPLLVQIMPRGAVALAVGVAEEDTARLLHRLVERLVEIQEERARSVGVQVMESNLGEKAGRCGLCGFEVGSEMVRCALCSMAHHPDCWLYLGRCSSFGCRGVDRPASDAS